MAGDGLVPAPAMSTLRVSHATVHLVTDWIELPDYPRTFASQCAPWGSVARVVKGVAAQSGGRPVTLSGAKAFLQRLESALIQARASTPELSTLLEQVLTAHARHIDVVEWCRVRGDELDLSLRVYASRGSQRLHLSLTGPVGAYADEPLPERATPPKARAPRKPAAKAVAVEPLVAPTVERVAPPSSPLVLRPIVADARPSYGDPIALDAAGRVHVALRLPDGDAFACVDPAGTVEVTRLPTREQLRELDAGAMTGAMLPSLHTSAFGLVRIDHYESTNVEQERVGVAGRVHAGRRGLFSHCWVLGVLGEWFLRCIVNNEKATLVGVHLGTGKRSRVALPAGLELRGAAVDHGVEGLVLRVLHGQAQEQRLRPEVGPKLGVSPVGSVQHGLVGAVQPVANTGGWVVAGDDGGRCSLRFVGADRGSRVLFTLPEDFTAPGYGPWGQPTVTQIGFGDAPRWQAAFDFGADEGPRCTGALVFAADGRVLGSAHVDAARRLQVGGTTIAFEEGEHVCGIAGGPGGDIAAVLTLKDGLGLVWGSPA